MTAFYIGQHEIDDEAAFADYLKQTIPFIEKHGGRYLTKAGTHEMLEGQRPSRVVVVEFPSKQAIKDWYMPQSHIDDPNEPKHMARPCAMCGFSMFLSLIEPSDKPDHDRRLFQCTTCEYSESVTVKYDGA